jgi:hypothetical protein
MGQDSFPEQPPVNSSGPRFDHRLGKYLNTKSMALDRAIAILEIATPIAEAIPILGAPVKGAFEATGKILKYAGVRHPSSSASHSTT